MIRKLFSKPAAAPRNLLVIGHSHVNCLYVAAARRPELDNVRVLNLRQVTKPDANVRQIAQAVRKAARGFKPDVVCLVTYGNEHNMLGIIENPEPFAIGDKTHGSAPAEAGGRHFIPHALMKAHFAEALKDVPLVIEAIYNVFPDAARMFLLPPPPIGDFNHIRKHPGIFKTKVALGPPPKPVRLQLYNIQMALMREFLAGCNAKVVAPAPQLLDKDGFLATPFVTKDPSHANGAYGAVMLDTLLKTMEPA